MTGPPAPTVCEAVPATALPGTLGVYGLTTGFRVGTHTVHAVDDLSLRVIPGETLAIVGESGSGKSVSMLSVMRLLDGRNVEMSGSVSFFDRTGAECDLMTADERTLSRIRGGDLAMIFQDASASLNPLFRVGDQIAETVQLHRGYDRKAAWAEAVALLRQVGIAAPEHRAFDYPHQLSGGMRQRVMIAIALAGEPLLLIADEPTTALDVTIQAQILDLLKELQRERGLAIILVTHDLGVVADFADRVLVMYAGQLVEQGAASAVLAAPRHPYTASLLASLPDPMGEAPVTHRRARPGIVPVIDDAFEGCRFRARCPLAEPRCENHVPLAETNPNWQSRCLLWRDASS